MEKFDFGMAMVVAKFTGREKNKSPDGTEREGSTKAPLAAQEALEKRNPLIPISWVKKLHRERIVLPSDKDLKGWKCIEDIFGSKTK